MYKYSFDFTTDNTLPKLEDNKEAFLQQYVLNRSKTSLNLDGLGAAKEAIRAWEAIVGACK